MQQQQQQTQAPPQQNNPAPSPQGKPQQEAAQSAQVVINGASQQQAVQNSEHQNAMQNQMFQLISQMAANAQDSNPLIQSQPQPQAQPQSQQNAQAQNAPSMQSEFQGPAPQVQGQPQSNSNAGASQQTISLQKAPLEQQTNAVQAQQQSHQGGNTQSIQGQPVVGTPQPSQQQNFAGAPSLNSQVIQGGIMATQPTEAVQSQAQPQPQPQQPVQANNVVGQAQPAGGNSQQTMESLISVISQLAQQPAQQQPQQLQPPQQQPQQVMQGYAPIPAQAPLSQEVGAPQQQENVQPQPGGNQEQTQHQQMQIVDILGQITKSLNTIKQAQQQQQQQQLPQQHQIQQLLPAVQVVTQPAAPTPNALPTQQPQSQPQATQVHQPQPQAQAQPNLLLGQGPANLNNLVLQLLSSAVQQQPALAQPQAVVAETQSHLAQPGGNLVPPQPYQHETVATHVQGAAEGKQLMVGSQGGFEQQAQDPLGSLRQNDMASLLQQMVNQQSAAHQSIHQPTQPQPQQQQQQSQQHAPVASSLAQAGPSQNPSVGKGVVVGESELQGEPQFIKFFVGGVLYSAKEGDVEAYFKRFGEVAQVAIMRDKMTGRSRGFAFVTFKERSPDSAAALKHRLLDPSVSHIIQDRKIEVRESDGIKPADSFLGKAGGGSQQQASAGQEQRASRDRGNRRGGDRQGSPRGQQSRDRGSNNQGRERQGEGGRSRRRRSRSRDRSRAAPTSKEQEDQLLMGTRDKVFVGGLEYGLADQDFEGHFQQYGVVKEAQIVRDPVSGQSRGFGFVTYHDASVAQRLINEMGHAKIAGRKVDLRKAELKSSDKIAILNQRANFRN